jgi:hypothetical protein
MDKISFDYKVHKKPKSLSIDTYINDKILFPKLNINIAYLEDTFFESGKYPLFVCSCGDENCGGVWESPRVTVKENTIRWELYEPTRHTFVFDKEEYIKEIQTLRNSLTHYRPYQNWYNVEYTALYYVGDFAKPYKLQNSHERE